MKSDDLGWLTASDLADTIYKFSLDKAKYKTELIQLGSWLGKQRMKELYEEGKTRFDKLRSEVK